MTERYYNIALGGDLPENVAEGAADTSLFVAVRVTYDATGATREQLVKALEAVQLYVIQDTFPPA